MPRPGQWLKFLLAPEKAAESRALAALGAHVTPDGYFVAIYAPRHTGNNVTVTRPDGTHADSDTLPERLMVCDARGHNVPTVVRQKDGSDTLANVYFALADVVDLQPLTDRAHLPPGYPPLPDDYVLAP